MDILRYLLFLEYKRWDDMRIDTKLRKRAPYRYENRWALAIAVIIMVVLAHHTHDKELTLEHTSSLNGDLQ